MLMSQVVVALFSPCFLLFFAAFYRLARPHLLDRFDASSSACRNLFFLFNFALRFCTVFFFFCCLPVVLLVLCMPQIMFGTPLTPFCPTSGSPWERSCQAFWQFLPYRFHWFDCFTHPFCFILFKDFQIRKLICPGICISASLA